MNNWLKTRAGNNLGHIMFGWIIMAPFLALGMPGTAYIAQSMYWLGRERRDHETDVGLNPFTEWWHEWNVLKWRDDNRADLLAPVIVNGIICLIAKGIQCYLLP